MLKTRKGKAWPRTNAGKLMQPSVGLGGPILKFGARSPPTASGNLAARAILGALERRAPLEKRGRSRKACRVKIAGIPRLPGWGRGGPKNERWLAR